MSSDPTTDKLLNLDAVNSEILVDLTNCDREPIHIPNSIQPHGILLAFSEPEYQIVQVSLNTQQILGIKPQDLLNQSLEKFLGNEPVEIIRRCLSEDFEDINPLSLIIAKNNSSEKLSFEGIVHRTHGIAVLELETTQPSSKVDFFNFYRFVKSPISKIQHTSNLDELCQILAQEVRKITEFDRVMVYRFDSEGGGNVIAEELKEGLEPYLGLHYPSTDIPQQAKKLYSLNFLRLIPDASYEPVGLIPELNPITQEPLDLSFSVLRSVSPIHTEYLGNMGVTASMSISLLKNKQLWGLIACHHNKPKHLPYQIRTVCEFLGQVVSFELAAKEENQDLDYKMKLKSIQTQFVETISKAEDLEIELANKSSQLLELVSAGGVALCLGEEFTLIGNTPTQEEILALLPWLETQFAQDVIYETNCLSDAYSPAEQYSQLASGMLALIISRVQKTYILWFRPEVIQTVNWGGNPHKPVEIGEDGSLRMSPRKSFALWQETVKLKSLPWKQCEVEAALELRSSIVSIMLRKADELTQVNKELERSNNELDAFAYIASHDLKEPLRGIYNYSNFLIEDYGETLDEEGVTKLQTLMRLTHRMEDLINSLLYYSRLGRAELRLSLTDINEVLAGVLDVLRVSLDKEPVDFRIPRSLPQINCDCTQVNELFTNLISNGIKYNNKPNKSIEIGFLDADDPIAQQKYLQYSEDTELPIIFYVGDNGIGIREKHLDTIFRIFKRLHAQNKYGGGTGAGLTIAKKIVERHGGEIWVESVYKKGSVFYFTLS